MALWQARDLFDAVAQPPQGGLNYAIELRHVLSSALKRSPHSRHLVAARMAELTGEDITKAQLDAWTAESKTPWRFPFAYAAAFEVACEDDAAGARCTDLQELLARKRGSRILSGADALYAELGRIQHQRAELDEQEKLIKRQLGEKKK